MAYRVADQLVDKLVEEGVERVYGVVGDSLNPATDANAVSLPSHITAGQAGGFGLTVGKLVVAGHIDEVGDTIETNIRHVA